MLPFMVDMISWSGEYDKETEAGDVFLAQARDGRGYLLESIKEKLVKEHLSS